MNKQPAKPDDMRPRNIVIIKTDQQRADTIGALGHHHMVTPNLDRLVNEGVAFTQAYCCAATCVASRAAFYTGMFAHNTGCYSFDEWSHHRSWVEELKDAGYHTAAIGKVHHSPAREMMGFKERIYTENFPDMRCDYDDYANYLKAEGQESPCKLLTQDGQWLGKCCSEAFPLEDKYHVDQYVGRMASRWIEDYEMTDPFFLHIGFQGPHDPYDPPQRYLDMYASQDVPLPRYDKGGLDSRPPQYRRFMEASRNPNKFGIPPAYGVWAVDLEGKSEEELKRMRRHYYAKITGIDFQIGKILDALESRDLLEDTLIIFTTDHGDNLGDHELMYKWLMTEQVVNVPFLVRLPNAMRGGTVDASLCSQIDVGPTILTSLGLKVPQRLDGRSNWIRWNTGDAAEIPVRVYCEDNYLTMVREGDRKLILYAGQEFEEYFDLGVDPREEYNLSGLTEFDSDRKGLKLRTMDWLMTSRYLGSLLQINQPTGRRSIWPPNHSHDPYVLNAGSLKTGR